MGVTITYPGTLPSLNSPSSFNDDALAFFQWVAGTGSGQLLGELANMDANDFFSVQSDATDATAGRLMPVGAFGLGSAEVPEVSDPLSVSEAGWYICPDLTAPGVANWPSSFTSGPAHLLVVSGNNPNNRYVVAFLGNQNEIQVRRRRAGVWGGWKAVWTESNTTVDGSGFILQASPIVRVYTDSISEPNKPVNATLTHDETGVYVLSGVPPLATEGWQVRTPEDVNGNKVVAIDPPEYDAEAGTLTLRTYDLLWQEGRLVPGNPMNVPGDYFVMLRFHEEPEGDEVAE